MAKLKKTPETLTIKVKDEYRGGLSYNNGKNCLCGDDTLTLPYNEAISKLREFDFLEEVKESAIIEADFSEKAADKAADSADNSGEFED